MPKLPLKRPKKYIMLLHRDLVVVGLRLHRDLIVVKLMLQRDLVLIGLVLNELKLQLKPLRFSAFTIAVSTRSVFFMLIMALSISCPSSIPSLVFPLFFTLFFALFFTVCFTSVFPSGIKRQLCYLKLWAIFFFSLFFIFSSQC